MMWLSRQKTAAAVPVEELSLGTVSIGGQSPAAVCDGEQRGLQIIAPGGYAWMPEVSDRILVLKQTALGEVTQPPVSLRPGECCLFSQNCLIHLTNDGEIYIQGKVIVNDRELVGYTPEDA